MALSVTLSARAVRVRVLDALPTTFVVHLVLTTLASFAASRVSAVLDRLAPDRSAVELLDSIEALFKFHAADTLGAPIVAVSLAIVVSTPLQMAWLAALRSSQRVRDSLATGLVSWPKAFSADLVLLLPAMALVGVSAALPFAIHLSLADSPNARLHDLAVMAGMLAPLISAVVVLAFRDLLRASLSSRDLLSAAQTSRRHLGRCLPWFVGLSLLSTGVAWAAWELAPGGWLGWVVLQPVAFLRVLFRSTWLGIATEAAEIS